MPPSTFASAAAGSSQNQNSMREGASDWSRRPNGATQTFRRQSNATTTTSATAPIDSSPAQAHPPRYVPPHRNGTIIDSRYSKSQLLDLYRSQSVEGGLRESLTQLYVNGWQPETSNGTAGSGWGRSEHARDVQPGPEVCWDRDGAVEPLGLVELDEDERELFTSSVNTPLKPPTTNKENQHTNGLQRKISISQGVASPGAFGLPSPSTTRSGMRRRDTSESYPFPNSLTSPTATRDDRAVSPPPSLGRRKTDMKDAGKADEEEKSGFGSVRRYPTGSMSGGLNGPSSPWSSIPLSSGFPAMGAFQQTDKRAGFGSGRAESRFKGVLHKDSNEDMGARTMDHKSSMSSLHKVDEAEGWRSHDRSELANAPLDEEDEDTPLPSGSAALGASSDASPSRLRQAMRGFDTPSRSNTKDEAGFGAFGMTADHAGFGMQQTPGHRGNNQEPMSPTDTNPYQSPEQYNIQHVHDDQEAEHSRLPGLGAFGAEQHSGLGGLGGFPGLGGLSQGPASDRSQTSSAGPARHFPGLGGLAQIGGLSGSSAWPTSAGGLGSANRQGMGLPSPFGQGIFSAGNDAQSPSLSGLGGSGLLGPQGTYPGGRLAGMFPQGMQDQMRSGDHDESGDDHPQTFGTIGQTQAFDESGIDHAGTPSQPPQPQQRTMVMPDRMRWIYKDPQGQTQGPWSGLEMHDWYRAGFFSPELLVKKAEDADYEPLAQLIRRIGNSREPFLVPQIGIPHGAPSTQGPWAGTIPGPPAAGAQPPFASSFPSFGTTLTAEQQNALERRKQEEQYLMARQKEHLAQAQIAQRIQMQGHGFGSGHMQNLNHHSSAQSLHSQPSMSSITSPSAYQPSPTQGPASGHALYDSAVRGSQPAGLGAVGAETLGHIREEEIPSIMDRLNLGGRAPAANQFGAPGQPFASGQAPRVQQMLQDRAALQQEQAQHDASQPDRPADNDRLREFQQLQGQMMEEQYQQIANEQEERAGKQSQEPLSLTEQVQKAASAKHSPAAAQQAWVESPLPAPAAQRTGRQSVADQLAQESSRTHTPSTEAPSAAIAPWAKEPAEVAKGPSLKEIQEMEAKKAAEAEEIAVAARRAALQRELEHQAIAAASIATVQPGLPAGAIWAGGSPATPTGDATSPWTKAAPQKPALVQTKSMAQIQKEEEARKKKLVAAQAQANASAMAAVVTPAGGKSYANLASKTGPAIVAAPGGAWTTVGASGKVKTPGAPSVPSTSRAVSSGIVPTIGTTRKAPTRSATMSLPGAVNAHEDFRKWAIAELRPELRKDIPLEDFVATLISFGPDLDLITEAVHGSSNTINSQRFAEEFVRKRKLADKGLVDTSATPKSTSPHNAGSSTAGGWSEVAKKGPTKDAAKPEESNGNFRVVASKKKVGKR
ncbi:hypothetical protein AMS68_006653 [Peltaster fructicola]|uniref:GYF domain-containing protein n=1 Tax=Peltaster fructicola TaxID=286661 RepID=A0A6H0Y2H4_9PEZI|nr:hypothetical protein AMS68_006653 [Peltaster fructicola]